MCREQSDELLDRGYAVAVVEAVESVPANLMDVPAKLLVTSCYGILGEKKSELRCLEELAEIGPSVSTLVSFHLANMYLIEGRNRDAIKMLLESSEPHPMDVAFAAYAYFNLGELDRSREYSMRALEAARDTGHVTAEAEVHMNLAEVSLAEGDLAAAETHLEIAFEATQRAGNVLAECSARTRRAMLRLAQGRYADALVAADGALALAERIGFAIFLAWALSVRGHVQYRLGRLDEAVADLTLGAARYEKLGGDPARGRTLVRLARTHLVRGDLAQARSAAETAVALGVPSENGGLHSDALGVLARVVVDDPDEAGELAQRAVTLGGYAKGEALLSRGWVALAYGDSHAAAADASAALAEARRLSRREWLAEALELQAASGRDGLSVLEEALSMWRELGNPIAETRVELAVAVRAGTSADAHRLRKKLRSLGVRDRAFRAAGPLQAIGNEDPAPVAIQTLGGFSVVRGGAPTTAAEWQSKKARQLVKLLVAARGRPLTREQLIETLWPEEPPSAPETGSQSPSTGHEQCSIPSGASIRITSSRRRTASFASGSTTSPWMSRHSCRRRGPLSVHGVKGNQQRRTSNWWRRSSPTEETSSPKTPTRSGFLLSGKRLEAHTSSSRALSPTRAMGERRLSTTSAFWRAIHTTSGRMLDW